MIAGGRDDNDCWISHSDRAIEETIATDTVKLLVQFSYFIEVIVE